VLRFVHRQCSLHSGENSGHTLLASGCPRCSKTAVSSIAYSSAAAAAPLWVQLQRSPTRQQQNHPQVRCFQLSAVHLQHSLVDPMSASVTQVMSAHALCMFAALAESSCLCLQCMRAVLLLLLCNIATTVEAGSVQLYALMLSGAQANFDRRTGFAAEASLAQCRRSM
jgi:hypothetical protein